MLFLEAMKTVVDVADLINVSHKNEHTQQAVSIIKNWMAGDAIKHARTPVTVIFHPSGDIELSGLDAQDIEIDDRRD